MVKVIGFLLICYGLITMFTIFVPGDTDGLYNFSFNIVSMFHTMGSRQNYVFVIALKSS